MIRVEKLARHFCISKKFRFRHTAKVLPHPEKVKKGGEDAFYAHQNILVVADGVGGWAEYGVDPAIYSKKLCSLIEKNFKRDMKNYIEKPQSLIEHSVGQNKETGSSTIVVVTLDPEVGTLRTAYLGDSIYSIYRGDPPKQIYAAQQQQHSFNFPFQVGTDGDLPSTSVKCKHDGELNDIIVVGSDGLWDNLHLKQLQSMINRQDSLQNIAEKIAKKTYKYSLSRSYKSPFHQKAAKAGHYYPPNGKSDDITLLMASIIKQ